MPFLGASIIAAVIFFTLNFSFSMLFDGQQATAFGAFFEALIQTAIFSTLFHYAHNWIAKLFRWYRIDEPEKPHLFDRNPALDQVREESSV